MKHKIVMPFFTAVLAFSLSYGFPGCKEGPVPQKEETVKPSDRVKKDENTGEGTKKIILYYFYGTGCPNCEKTEPIVNNLSKEHSILLKKYEVWYNKKNRSILLKMAKERNKSVKGVPTVIIGEDLLTGLKKISGLKSNIHKYQ